MKSFSDWVRAHGTGECVCSVSAGSLSHIYAGPHAILRPDFVDAVAAHADELDEAIIHARDYCFYL